MQTDPIPQDSDSAPVPEAENPPHRKGLRALPPFARRLAVLAVGVPLAIGDLALFSFATIPERPLAPACAAMALFCLYASAAQVFFLLLVRRLLGAGAERGFAVFFLVQAVCHVFSGVMAALSGWRDFETEADLGNSAVLLVWAVVWTVFLIVRAIVRPLGPAAERPPPTPKARRP